MAFLTLNNLTIPVADASAKRLREQGANGRRWGGGWRNQQKWSKRRWDVETNWLLATEAEALEHWLMGRGDHWPFDFDMYAEITGRGPGPAAINVFGLAAGPAPQRFSDPVGSVLLVGNATPARQWQCFIPAMADGSYTVSWWMWINQATYNSWRHYVQTFDAGLALTQRWLDGVLIAPGVINNYTIAAGLDIVFFQQRARNVADSADIFLYIEDLVMCPYRWTDAMISAVRTSADAFGLSPRLRMRGDLLDEPGPVHVRVDMREIQHSQGRPAIAGVAGWQNNLRKLSFTLAEV